MLTELELLCQWLDGKNNLVFTQYYNEVAKKLLFYIDYQLGASKNGLAEDIFHDVMVKSLSVVKERPQVAKCIEVLAKKLRSIELNHPFFEKRLITWSDDISHWTKEAISFPQEHRQIKSPELDDKVKKFNDKIESLKKEGKVLLDWLANNKRNTLEEAEFIENIHEILKLLSKIRIPTIALLYAMAKNKVIDHSRKKSTQLETALEFAWDGEDENEYSSMIEADTKGYQQWVFEQKQGITDEAGNKQQILQQAVEFLLQAPIRKAETELQQATDKQQKQRSENRLDKAQIHYIENLRIFEMMKDQYTQEEIASHVGLTRDQVRTCQTQIKTLLEPLKKGDLL